MGTWAVIASGQSLTSAQVEAVRKFRARGVMHGMIAVSNVGIDLAPDADVLASHDSRWWRAHPAAFKFSGRKFCRHPVEGTEHFIPPIMGGCNSGLFAMEIAARVLGARKIILLGLDMGGTHYFGRYTDVNLTNTTPAKFRKHIRQFKTWVHREIDVVNCTPGTELLQFRLSSLEKELS